MDARIYATYNNTTTLLYSSAANDDKSAIINPQVKAEIGKAGSLTFTILPTHPMYDDMLPFLTFLRVEIDGTEIFYGRVLETSKDIYNQKNVTCEGDLTYLMDSVCTPGDYNETVTAFFTRCINWHNSQVEAAKQLRVGNVTIGAKNRTVKFDVSNYTTIADLLETEVIGYYGGYLRTRNQNGSRYIDLIKEGDSSSNQVIEYGSQMLDLTNDERANDLFTIVLAVGDSDSETGEDYNFPTARYEVPGAIAKYGRITHVESFSGITNTSELASLAQEYASSHYDPYPTELSIKAIDLHIIDGTIQTIVVGNTVKIQSTPHNLSKNLMCVSIDYDLQNPENTSYVFGHPKQSLSQRYNKEKKTATAETAKASKSGKRGGGAGKKNAADLEQEKKERIDDVEFLTFTAQQLEIKANDIIANLNNLTISVNERFQLQADEIALRATKVELEAVEEMALKAQTMKIATDRLDISSVSSGVVASINANRSLARFGYMELSQLVVGSGGLTCNSYLVLLNRAVTWQDRTVVTEVKYSTNSANSAVMSGGEIVGVHSFDYSRIRDVKTEEIHYLGRS